MVTMAPPPFFMLPWCYGIRNLAIGKENRCFIELGTKSLAPEQMNRIEAICNDQIRNAVAMTPRWCTPGSPEMNEVGHVMSYVC